MMRKTCDFNGVFTQKVNICKVIMFHHDLCTISSLVVQTVSGLSTKSDRKMKSHPAAFSPKLHLSGTMLTFKCLAAPDVISCPFATNTIETQRGAKTRKEKRRKERRELPFQSSPLFFFNKQEKLPLHLFYPSQHSGRRCLLATPAGKSMEGKNERRRDKWERGGERTKGEEAGRRADGCQGYKEEKTWKERGEVTKGKERKEKVNEERREGWWGRRWYRVRKKLEKGCLKYDMTFETINVKTIKSEETLTHLPVGLVLLNRDRAGALLPVKHLTCKK